MQRYRMLDLLRALAAFLVLLTHVGFWTGASGRNTSLSGPLLSHGDVGVAIFFAISAFLLLRPYIRSGLANDRRPNLRRYAIHRTARILPAYLVALSAVLVVAALAPGRTGGVGSAMDVVRHVVLLQGYADQRYQAFSQTWSLSTEVTFYALVPVLGHALGRTARHARRGWFALGAVVVLGLFFQAGAAAWARTGPNPFSGVLGLSVLGHAAWFAVGAAIALLAETESLPRPPLPDGWTKAARSNPGMLALAAGFLYLVGGTSLTGPVDLQAFTVTQAVTKEVLYAAIAALLVLAATSPVRGVLSGAAAGSPAARWLGDTSYPFFLWHVLVLQLLYLLTGRALFSGAVSWALIATTAFSVLLARASVRWIERPVMVQAYRVTRDLVPGRTG